MPILKALATANRSLAELKGRAGSIPNQGILIDILSLQEARASSEIENIVTTSDDLFQVGLYPGSPGTPAAKEVALYRDALKLGSKRMGDTGGLILNSMLVEMFRLLKNRKDGFRRTPGTALRNQINGEIVYVPPQEANEIDHLMGMLEVYINDGERSDLDPLIRMALIHHQFESIHPFPDDNGRIGRILNVLYLTRTGLLDIPILYLSRHITQHKGTYYRLLQAIRTSGVDKSAGWEEWVLFILEAVAKTSKVTLELIEGIREQMAIAKNRMRDELPQIYSQDLLNSLFRHPYTRIDYVVDDLGVTRQTAAKYLDVLAERGFVKKVQSGRSNYFVNSELVALFSDDHSGI